MRNVLWATCKVAALGYLVVAGIWLVSLTLMATGICSSNKGVLVCRDLPGDLILSYVSLLPLALFVGAPIMLRDILFLLVDKQELGPLIDVIMDPRLPLSLKVGTAFVSLWFLLGIVGLARFCFERIATFRRVTLSSN